ncbi:MCE family protein [Gordonia sp. zg691]|uniref:MlaD family protein n=1 Tax=Gordonia jinghuaiqii TaxID=2758710 RepID=UPI00166229C4|nr:MlaD family protein [Gordonia jinghuaiqii]MBD0863545.1 MCE family protein [Gordonia jinghuaiqii]
MSARPGFVETGARGIVAAVDWGRRRRNWLSVLGLLTILVVGVAYLMLDTLQRDPTASHIRVEVELAQSGGLLPNQDVTLRGVPVGRVDAVRIDDDGVRVVATIDAGIKIPADGEVRVSSLSPAGEQFLDFRPSTDSAPFITDGTVVEEKRTTTPVPMATLLENMDPALAQIDTGQLTLIMDELGTGEEGAQKLRDIVRGGTFLVSTLDSVLPQTVNVIRTSKVVLTTLADTAPGLRATAGNLRSSLAGVGSMDAGFRQMLDQTPATLRDVDQLFTDNSPTMVQLLGNLVTVSQMAYLRVPALREFFFPTQRSGSALDAISTAFRDGGLWGSVDVFPRVPCDYHLPRSAPSRPDFPEPFLNTHCKNTELLPRGAGAAPRPPGDDTNLPRPGSDPHARTDPTPRGPQTIPTPFGGPDIHFN